MRLSRPNPANATDRACQAANVNTNTPTTFQPRVATSSLRPHLKSRAWRVLSAISVTRPVSQTAPPIPLGRARPPRRGHARLRHDAARRPPTTDSDGAPLRHAGRIPHRWDLHG